jgi:HK97 family phage prohead protease
MPHKSERRFAIDAWQAPDFQIRAEGDGMTFEGYAAVFDTDSDGPIPGWGVERIAPGAFAPSLKSKRDIKMFLNHNSDLVLASRNGGTLDLEEDDRGLLARARFIDTTLGIDTAKNVKAGNISKMSFGFSPERFAARKDGVDGTIHTRVQLWETSPLTSWPAYSATSAFVRHLAEATDTDPDELSEALRLLDTEEALADEHYNTLLRVINTRRGEREPVLAPKVADWRAKLAAIEAA